MSQYRVILAMIGMFMFAVCWQGPNQAVAQVNVDVGGVHVHVGDRPQPQPEREDAVVVLTRGPVHEAFAQPVVFDDGDGYLITHKPPAPLEEMIPDERPEGSHIVWIPGYWGYDNDRDDFIWVSGCWRAVPPNTGWVPGYWAQVKGGYQWIAGFWDTADAEEIEYLPSPPESLEEGPQGTASADSIWIPGCWVRQENRYAWRPGFWEKARADWVWEPAHYVCSPRGCIYVDGYWDYPLSRRGVAFLPVYCPARLYGRSDFRYSPEYTLDLGVLEVNFFSSPQRHHYYFGDYYGTEYSKEGFHPWYEARDRHEWYDPIFVHEQWSHRDDRKWVDNQRDGYDHRRDDKALRPARTYDAMQAQVAAMPEKDRRGAQMARPLKEVAADKSTPYKFNAVDAKTREASAKQAKEVHAYKDQRSQWESPAAASKTGPEPKEVVTPKEPARATTVEPARTTPKELPKEPTKEVTPKEPARTGSVELPKTPAKEVAAPERAQTADRGAIVKEPTIAPTAQPGKVKIPKPPIAVREPVTDKALTPPARPDHPQVDLNAKPRAPRTDTPDRSKDRGASDKGDPEKK